MVEGVTDEAAVTQELESYARLLPTSHSLVATLFFEHDDVATVKDELLRVTGIQHGLRLEVGADLGPGGPPTWILPGIEVPGEDEPGPSQVTHAVHFLRFAFGDEARDAFRDPGVPAVLAVDHPEYAASTEITGDVRLSLIADLSLDA